MITDQVIQEIYKKYRKPCKNEDDLQLDYFIDLLSSHHNIKVVNNMEVIIEDLEEYNPFRRFLKRGLFAILEFDKDVAFVFRSHLLFVDKSSSNVRVHIRPEEPKSFFSKLFGK